MFNIWIESRPAVLATVVILWLILSHPLAAMEAKGAKTETGLETKEPLAESKEPKEKGEKAEDSKESKEKEKEHCMARWKLSEVRMIYIVSLKKNIFLFMADIVQLCLLITAWLWSIMGVIGMAEEKLLKHKCW